VNECLLLLQNTATTTASESQKLQLDAIMRPDVYARYRRVLREAPLLVIEGTVQRKSGVINLLAWQVLTLPRLAVSLQDGVDKFDT
jgi:DNA polymerase III alpha subunit